MRGKTRILIFGVNWLGDVLFSTPTIRNIKYNFPSSFITCIVPWRCIPILEGNPSIDEIISFDEKHQQHSLKEKLKFIRLINSKRFDMVFLLHRSFTRALICFLAGIPQRIGYATKKRGFLLTRRIKPIDYDSLHRIDYYLNMIERAGLKIYDRYPEFFIDNKDIDYIKKFLEKEGVLDSEFLVGINPGANWLPKRWPKDYWRELINRLTRNFSCKVIITGDEKDRYLAEEIACCFNTRKPILASGLLNLKQFGALCKRLDLFISADTGPLHIANALKTKRIIALFGPTSLKTTSPYPLDNVLILQKDVGCRIPCYVKDCFDNRCMRVITPQEIVEVIEKAKIFKV
ncbi:MAG: lipopolysaccharide heptosyltransferase II [Candidatus Omnitrophica bacterium]|nr:lipopolysaccharide heptosyltransferase II [Candidatus Omnitrophota bacterium]